MSVQHVPLFTPVHLRLTPICLAIGMAVSTQLQAAPSSEATQLEAVRVTDKADDQDPSEVTGAYTMRKTRSATGLSLSARETPQSVSVATRAKMDDFGLNSVNQVLENTTGVVVEKVETDRTYYSARGFDITNFQTDGTGLPFTATNALGDIDTAVYDRIEVVRGAAGLLSPTGNPSATVNFISKRPTSEFQTSGALTFGSWNQRRLEADVSGPLNQQASLRGRVVLVKEKSDSYLDRYAHDKTVFYGVIEADLGNATTLAASYTRQNNHAQSPLWGGLPLNYSDGSATHYDTSTSTAADWAYWDTQDQRAVLELAHRFNDDWQAKLKLTHRQQRGNSNLFYLYGTPERSTGLGLYSYPSSYASDLQQDILNLDTTGQFSFAGQNHQLSFGATLSRSRLHDRSGYGSDIGTALTQDLDDWNGSYTRPAFNASSNGSTYVDRTLSVYGALHYALSEQLKLIAGSSVTQANSSGTNYGVAHQSSDTGISPYLGLVYDINRNLSAYGSFTRIFTPQSEKTDLDGNTLAAAKGWNQEAGLKSEWLDKKLNASLALFRTRQDNLAEEAGVIGARTFYQNTNVHSQGFETEISGQPAPGWQTTLGYTQLSIQDASGQAARTYTPRKLLRLSTTWRLPFAPAVKLGASINRQSDTWRDQGNGVIARQSAYTLVNLMASYDINKNLTASARVNNLGNVKYWSSLYWSQSYYAAPRNASVSLSWKY